MKTISTLGVAIAALTLAGCTENVPTNGNLRNVNNNTAVVVNSNQAPITNSSPSANSNRWSNSNVNRADYDRDRADYEKDKGSSTIGQGANDSWLWFKTRSALMTTNDLRESTINVDVVNDVVTLRGTVANAAEKAKAESVAKGIDGVKSVKNELKVSANDSMTNQMVNGSPTPKSANMSNKK